MATEAKLNLEINAELVAEIKRLTEQVEADKIHIDELRAIEIHLQKERSELKRENTALRAFLVEMSEGSAYFEKKVETLFTALNSLKK